MSGDPKECRMRAVQFAELAVAAKAPFLRATFLGLSKQWEKIATDLELIQAVLDEEDADFKKPA